MATNLQSDVFESIPEEWYEPVLGLWVVVLAIAGMVLTLQAADRYLAPLGGSAVGAVVVTTVSAAIAYGGFGVGLTYVYLERRPVGPGFLVERFDRSEWHWLAGLGGLTVALVALGGVWSSLVGRSFEIVTTPLWLEPVPIPDGLYHLDLGLQGANALVDVAPMVVLIALLGGVVIAPGVGALFHGVLQNTLARVGPPAVVPVGTALAVTLAVSGFSYNAATTFRGFSAAVAVFAFVLGVAYAYRETENLLVPMAAYGMFSAFTLVVAWANVVVGIYLASGSI